MCTNLSASYCLLILLVGMPWKSVPRKYVLVHVCINYISVLLYWDSLHRNNFRILMCTNLSASYCLLILLVGAL